MDARSTILQLEERIERRFDASQARDPHTGEWIDTTPGGGFAARVKAAVTGADALHDAAYRTDEPDIQHAIDNYGGEGTASYFDVNLNLRGGNEHTPAQRATQDGLDRALKGHGLPRDIVVHRQISGPEQVFGGTYKDWWPGGTPPNIVGMEWRDKGFVSTAIAPGGSGFVMRILAPKGTEAISNEGLDRDEVLLNRGLRFRVVADHGLNHGLNPCGDRAIDVEVVP